MKLAENVKLRSGIALLVMLAGVAGVYWPMREADFPADRGATLLGSDFLNLHARRLRYAREALFGPGHFLPAWHTRELGGSPFWSNVQNFPFIPTRLPLLLLDPEHAYAVGVMIAALLAATFTFLYLREIHLGAVASAVGGWTFACSGFFASRVMAGHLPLLEAYPALPLLLWTIERYIAMPQAAGPLVAPARTMRAPLGLVAIAVASMCIALAGHPQIPIYSFAIAGLYILLRARDRRAFASLSAMILGIGLASFALVPMMMLTARSTRVLNLSAPPNDLALPYGRILAMLFPWRDGWPPRVRMPQPATFHGYPDPAYFWDTVSYVGWLPILAVVFLMIRAIAKRQTPSKIAIFFILTGVAALLFALPWWQAITAHIPGTILRSPARQIYITTFALAIAAAAAIDVATRFALAQKPALLIPGIALLLALHAWDLGSHDRAFVRLVPVGPRDDRALEALRQRVGPQRVAIDCILGTRANRQIDDIGFFDSILLARPYRALMEVSGQPEKLNIQNLDGSKLVARALQFFGVQLMITIQPPQGALRPLQRSGPVTTYEVENPIPRASLIDVPLVRQLSIDEIHQRLRRPDFDLDNNLLLPTGAAPPPAGQQPGTPRRVDYSHNSSDEFVARVSTPRPAYLRLLEAWDDGWHATLDSAPVEIIPAYDTFMVIPIPAGRHEIRLTYSTPGATAGLLASALSVILLCGLCGLEKRRQAGQALASHSHPVNLE